VSCGKVDVLPVEEVNLSSSFSVSLSCLDITELKPHEMSRPFEYTNMSDPRSQQEMEDQTTCLLENNTSFAGLDACRTGKISPLHRFRLNMRKLLGIYLVVLHILIISLATCLIAAQSQSCDAIDLNCKISPPKPALKEILISYYSTSRNCHQLYHECGKIEWLYHAQPIHRCSKRCEQQGLGRTHQT
jgi:hypothetical protein